MNILSSQIFQYAGTFSIATMGFFCYRYSRKNNHVLDNKVLLFWMSLQLGLVSLSRLLGQLEVVDAVVSRSISGLIGLFVLMGFLVDKRKSL